MERLVRVHDGGSGGGGNADPLGILEPLRPEADRLFWAVRWWGDALVREASSGKVDLFDVERRVEQGERGLELSFEELFDLAGHMVQIVDALFVGCVDRTRLPLADTTQQAVVARADMLVAAFDSSWWWVGGPADVVARFDDRYEDVVDEDPTDPGPLTI